MRSWGPESCDFCHSSLRTRLDFSQIFITLTLLFSPKYGIIKYLTEREIMLGYIETDVRDMIDALDSVLTTINSDDDPWLYNNTFRAKDLLEGLLAEGHI
jgi:hypothetical protein